MSFLRNLLRRAAYSRKARQLWYRAYYDSAAASALEVLKFKQAGFDRERALVELERELAALALPGYSACGGMASVHWLLFACLRQQQPPARILEIGTYDGQTTALLARLFPAAQIITVELPAWDPILRQTYGRSDRAELESFARRLAANTSAPNITLLKINSFFVPAEVRGSFDLIWIDGGHLYPEVAWDLCNAYHLAAPGGYIMCDDVVADPRGWSDSYVSPDSHNVLRYICTRTNEPLALFLKRESPLESADPRTRKFVALLHKMGPAVRLSQPSV